MAADTRDSLAKGEISPWPSDQTSRTIADGLRAEAPAPITFRHMLANLDGVLTVSDDEIVAAMAVAAREAHLVVEPSGATPLAGLLFHDTELPPGPRVVVLSGGNVDPARYLELLAAAPA
jgi:threonine dehydratase